MTYTGHDDAAGVSEVRGRLTHLDGDLADGPRRVVTHRDELRVDVRAKNRYKLGYNSTKTDGQNGNGENRWAKGQS